MTQPRASCGRFRATVLLATLAAVARAQEPEGPAEQLDPAAWGEDHVGRPLPEYITGDECLFCHRNDIGPTWDRNFHARTIRFKNDEEPEAEAVAQSEELRGFLREIDYVLGRRDRVRYLRRGGRYGMLDLASFHYTPPAPGDAGGLGDAAQPRWEAETFGQSCAGCHATAVESRTAAFSAFSIDCYACHGAVTLTHTADTALMLLSRKRRDPAPAVASICGQCHLRGGTSRSTGRPYPDQFVPGDNLFKDYEVDFSEEAIGALAPGDRHIYQNIRDIVILGRDRITCLDCHQVHLNSSERHIGVRRSTLCATCHTTPEGAKDDLIPYERHSALCRY